MAGNAGSSPFRKDINALRAIAVLLVVLYHFGVRHFGGGFIGVDEFFVISGFLMTQIVSTRLEAKQFSFLAFYSSRARRIAPALIVVTASVLALGYFYLDPDDYLILGKHAASSLTFTSNLLYYREAGYFDRNSQDKWLLHTWSLSVEWQFYLLFPLFLVALIKFQGGKRIVGGVLLALGGSFLLSLFLTSTNQPLAFFSLPTRAWELLAGSACHLYLKRFGSAPRLTWLVGLGLVTVPAFLYTERLAYPGYWAIAPVLGTSLVIVSRAYSDLLAATPVQFLGNISYSLYLWHWPTLLAARYWGLTPSFSNVGLLFAFSVALAYASYVLVELPFRRGTATSGRFLVGSAAALGALATAAAFVWHQRGVPNRLTKEVVVAANEAFDKSPRAAECLIESSFGSELPQCRIGVKSAPPSAALWGDSHSFAVLSAVADSLAQTGRSGVYYGMAACPPVLGITGFDGFDARPQCPEFNEKSASLMLSSESIRDVFVVGRWSKYAAAADDFEFPATSANGRPIPALPRGSSSYFRRIKDTLCILRESGKTVFALAPIPEMSVNVPKTLARAILTHTGDKTISLSMNDYSKRHGPVLSALREAERECGVRVIYPTDVLCENNVCAAVRGGRPIYFDSDHLSEFGNRPLVPLLFAAVESARHTMKRPSVNALLQRVKQD